MDDTSDRLGKPGFTAEQWLGSARLKSIVFSEARRLAIAEQDRPDVLQAVMAELCDRHATQRFNVSYVTQVARHRAIDFNRENRPLQTPVQAPNAPNPETRLLLHSRVKSLEPASRKLFGLLYEEALTEREAADRLGVSRGAIRGWKERFLARVGALPTSHEPRTTNHEPRTTNHEPRKGYGHLIRAALRPWIRAIPVTV